MREYESLVAWDFHKADAEWAQPQAKFMAGDLERLAATAAVALQVSVRRHRVELSMRAVTKGRLVGSLLDMLQRTGGDSHDPAASIAPPSFVFTAGDDVTDEDMFCAAKKWVESPAAPAGSTALNVFVGRATAAQASSANFVLPSVTEVQAFIVALHAASKPSA